tara:strand:+ start:10041 stop:11432 length:1392 start_codon:yes stop_codon:yes gene_type:complete
MRIKNICCIGAGYVGGPSMAIIAKYCPDIQVNVVDINPQRIAQWNDKLLSNLPIYEPGLDKIIQKCRNKNLHFSNNIKQQIENADMIFISVNTPTKLKGIGAGQAIDLRYVEASSREISKYAKGHTIVVEKSTLPVKTAQTIKDILDATTKKNISDNKTFSVLSNPEFLAEGTAIKDLENPDRVLIGGEDRIAIDALVEIYSKWIDKNKVMTTDLWSSELSKLIANAFLAQRISSINTISALCEATGAQIKDVALAVGMDKRIGRYFLNSGPGFGGSCFKKDISNLVYISNHYGLFEVANYWQKVLDINSWQQERFVELIVKKMFGTISSKTIAILGFSFKANTNDTRESPAIYISKKLIEEGAFLKIYDPKVTNQQIELDLQVDNQKNLNKNWIFCESIYDVFEKADAAVFITEWQEFEHLDWLKISNIMIKPSWIFDTRSIVNIEKVKESNLNIWQVGYGY